ncbi:MAG TPA: efflux RND transporter periplasmic adaptor subunit [Draconibacterium sp.]|nr:efflux RND transporter periplasmic adaptor subunit [Draconibacterium sp.]
MKKLNTILTVLTLGVFILSSCNSKQTESAESTSQAVKIERIRVFDLQPEEITRSVVYTAAMEPFNVVHMAPTSPGRIEKINVEMGDRVKQGDELVRMNDAQLIQAEIQLNNVKINYTRIDTLNKLGSVAAQQYDQLKAQYDAAKENVDFLRKNTILIAPFNGIISGKYFEPGEMYSGSPIATVGKAAILSIIQVEKLKAIVNVSEEYLPFVKKGMEVKLLYDVYPDDVFTGKVIRISPTISAQSRTFEIEISVNNPEEKLKPGIFGRVTIPLEKTSVLVLPAESVLKMQGSNVRYLFKEENGIAKRVEVEIGQRFNDKLEVISKDLKEGDKIVVEGQERLLDGNKVEVVK